MAISNAMCLSYKQDLFGGTHVAADVYKIILIKVGAVGTYDATFQAGGTPGAGTPSATNIGTDEAAGTGYTTGGATLAGFSVTLQGTTAVLDFTTPTWPTATVSAIGAVIINTSKSNKAVATFTFGGTITSTGATFTASMPAVGSGTSLLRIA